MVIAILGLMAGLTVPVLKNFAKSDATIGASRQLLDGVARARQLAISQRTTVYLVFVPPNFWVDALGNLNTAWFNSLTAAQQTAVTNLCDKQLTGYTFVSLRSVGDQPGRVTPHYLAPWQNLPDYTFIPPAKFTNSPTQSNPSRDPVDPSLAVMLLNVLNGFNYTNIFPFPTETTPINTNAPALPYIAFNYLGQLASGQDEYIPIAKGSVIYALDPATKMFRFGPLDASENPPGNSTNSSYNIVHIDWLTGRAVLEYQKMQ